MRRWRISVTLGGHEIALDGVDDDAYLDILDQLQVDYNAARDNLARFDWLPDDETAA